MDTDVSAQERGWQGFVEGEIYTEAEAPWRDDPAFALLCQFPGLRDSVGGNSAAALTQAIGLVRALAQVDLLEGVRANRPAYGLCLGFGMNALEPYDLLRVFELDQVHAYEWIGEHVIEAAQLLAALPRKGDSLSARIRLHHGTISDLSALADDSIRVISVANVFNPEIPMVPQTFAGATSEILRVLASKGVLVSRGSSGALEAALSLHGRMLLQTPLVSVFQKEAGNRM
jgi:hypothetical protein